MNSKLLRAASATLLAFALVASDTDSHLSAAEPATPGRGDLIRFRDGDSLYGKLEGFDAMNGLRWKHPDAAAPILFKGTNLLELQFSATPPASSAGNNACLVRLGNQDELSGELLVLDAEKLVLDTWHAGRLTIPRTTVQFLQTKPPPVTPVFAGPTGLEGWTIGKVTTAATEAGEWRYKNGAFYAMRAASIARDIKLPDTASLEFDLAWRGSFHVAIALYTDYLQPISLATKENEPDFGGFYSLQLNNYYANLLAVTKNEPLRYLGQAPLQSNLGQKNSVHVEIRADKAKNILALLIDGALVKAWTDSQTIAGRGTGIRLVHQGQGSVRLSALRVSPWDGQFEEKPTNPPNSREDLAKLRNGDRLQGALEQIRDGKMFFNVSGRSVEVPLIRVKQIEIAGMKIDHPKTPSTASRAQLQRGGAVTVDLLTLDAAGWQTQSPVFGKAVFRPDAFSKIEFAFPAVSQ